MTPPTLDQLEAYAKLRNLSVDLTQFLMHYEDSEPPWTDKNGKPVKNWKLTMQTWHFGNMRRADTHRCTMCPAYACYVYKDATGQPYWRCVSHKKKVKDVPDIAKTIKFREVPSGKVNVNDKRNEERRKLGL